MPPKTNDPGKRTARMVMTALNVAAAIEKQAYVQ
jgi:hypothetical protein